MVRLCYTLVLIALLLTVAHARQDFDSRVESIRRSQQSVIRSDVQSQAEESRVRALESDYAFLFRQG